MNVGAWQQISGGNINVGAVQNRYVYIDGTIEVVSAISGSLSISLKISGQIDSISTVDGVLGRSFEIIGQIDATSELSGYIRYSIVSLNGAIDSSSTISGFIKVLKSNIGSLISESSVSGTLREIIGFNGSIDVVSSVLGNISKDSSLAGQINAISVIVAIARKIYFPTAAETFLKLNYIDSSNEAQTLTLNINEVYQITLTPNSQDDIQRKQDNLAIKYSNDISNKLISVLLEPSQDLVIETLRTVTEPMTMFIYVEGSIIHSFYVQLDRESCKQFREFDLVSNENIELLFYEVESGYSAQRYFNNGICF